MLMSCQKRHGTTPLKIERLPSFESCMVACGAMPQCLSADYEPRTKKCFLGNNTKNPLIAAEAFLSAHSLGCSGACAGCKSGCDQLDTDSLPADTATCPNDTGRLLSAGGQDIRLYCSHCYLSHGSTDAPAAKSIVDCAKLCGEDSSCHGANWIDDHRCVFHHEFSSDGSKTQFKADASCHALAPQDRSMPAPQ